ncbi:transcriptional regulator GutM [Propionibacterium australiense]|uniref:Glucitol operon activator protein (GutM) n=1 Tax=Propionibacterium australiense TaxID=119981 RepID=A0A383S4M9_9ACTN|nr:transcriptional regulator GutM [Propionibacterium australiense]RLP10042.1 transcriptional regulator [Propionibacterium australiense]RLP11326.1 transcriptional regulator [Propionibacterium australiense]SYZ32960.1 Glucitol operon activator protein (GutM) [Propionibacterium australiense]VEH92349.1 DNA-binding transcriptional activator GutM [Propionibacterium australiense]
MNFWFLLTALGVAYLGQMYFSTVQMKDFSTSYAALRRRGKVAIGKRRNALSAGAIAMLLLDEDGTIVDARVMSGLTVLARFKPLAQITGQHIADLDPGSLRRCPKGLRLAVENAQSNWVTVQNGGVPAEPLSPLGRLLARLPGPTARPAPRRAPGGGPAKKKQVTAVPARPAATHVVTATRTAVRSTRLTQLEGVTS